MAKDMQEEAPNLAFMRLFHPRGPQVSIPMAVTDPAGLLKNVSDFLDAGWLVQAPGLEVGEERDQVAWVLRSNFENKDHDSTPFLLLYSVNEQLTYSFLKVYLNSDSDIAAFEYASGMKLANLPEYIGKDKPQRGASSKVDKYIVHAPRPFGVVYKKNPKHDPSEKDPLKMKPARLFVRWENQRPAAEAPKSDGPDFDHAPEPQPESPPQKSNADRSADAAEKRRKDLLAFMQKKINNLVRDRKILTPAQVAAKVASLVPGCQSASNLPLTRLQELDLWLDAIANPKTPPGMEFADDNRGDAFEPEIPF